MAPMACILLDEIPSDVESEIHDDDEGENENTSELEKFRKTKF